MSDGQVAIRISPAEDADTEELADLTYQLREELLELDVEAVEQPAGQAPEGTKAGGVLELGSLIVSLGGAAISALIPVIQAWLKRSEARSVVMEIDGDKIEVRGASSEAERLLVNDWIGRHPG